ncbi:MAG: chemotaxis protein CheW [Spirochaetia bacterium]|nr:chemotaxis protein CheW [Spirochaetia bacterium]
MANTQIKKGILENLDFTHLDDFIDAAEEHLHEVESELMKIEENSETSSAVENIFRCFHSIKGDSGSIGLTPVSELTHEIEEIFDLIRDNKMKISKVLIDSVFEAINVIRYFMTAVSQRKEPEQDTSWLIDKFEYIKTTPYDELEEDEDEFDFKLDQENKTTIESDDDLELDESSLNTYVMFRVGNLNCALPLYKCEEVVEKHHLTRVPFIKNHIQGVINLRGNIVPVINLRSKFNLNLSDFENEKILITGFDNHKIGLKVDEVFAIEEVMPENISEPDKNIINPDKSFVSGVFKSHDVLVFALSYERILSKNENGKNIN